MKQKVVIRLSLCGNDHKCRTKAFKIAVSQSGVESAAIKGDDKNQLEVVGEVDAARGGSRVAGAGSQEPPPATLKILDPPLDAATLTRLLRKSLGQADIVSVGPAGGGDKKAGSDTKPAAAAAVVQSQPALYCYDYPSYQYPVYQVTHSYDQQGCSIM